MKIRLIFWVIDDDIYHEVLPGKEKYLCILLTGFFFFFFYFYFYFFYFYNNNNYYYYFKLLINTFARICKRDVKCLDDFEEGSYFHDLNIKFNFKFSLLYFFISQI